MVIMKDYALIGINNLGSEIIFGRFEKMPTLKQANKEMLLREAHKQTKIIAILETNMSYTNPVEMRYESMAWILTPIDKSLVK
jgi:hypothetical protein